ncbi:MAG TPA: hypothetical protein VGG68_00805 [Caulobacteraceae bacterium]|jgi:hypothetical protein
MARNSIYGASAKQWSYFRSLTGDTLPDRCTKAQASSLIKKALAGEYVRKLRCIEVGRFRLTTWDGPREITWDVFIDHRSVSHHPTQEAAMAVAEAACRDGETVVVKDSIYELLTD